MAKTNLLSTRTANYADLVGNGRTFSVLPYQRDYSWQEEQWEDLWNDVMDLTADPQAVHYMGALVVEDQSDREFAIIDGQQRLATISLLGLAILARLEQLAATGVEAENNRERAQVLRNRFLSEQDAASLLARSKLNLNANNNGFYQDYLVALRAPANPRSLAYSNRLLWNCFQFFHRKIQETAHELSTGISLASLLSETIGRQLIFILIVVDDELNAYTVFETLNGRGLELSATDLLKNYLFSRIRTPTDLEVLQRRWQSLVSTVGQEKFPEFLRYHLLCEMSQVRSQRLFKLIKERINQPADVFRLIDALEDRAELFAAIGDPQHGFWVELPEAKSYIKELELFRVRQMMPLLFAAWEKLDPRQFVSVLRLVSIASFRYHIVCGYNTNALEPAYHRGAKALLTGQAQSPAELFGFLQADIYPGDDAFRENFAALKVRTKGPGKKLAKYILAHLEQRLNGRAVDFETDPGTIEHILPESPGDGWETPFPTKYWDEAIYRLGNLTLLEAVENRQVGNALYSLKTEAYQRSSYELSRNLINQAPEEWTLPHLEQRQRNLARLAVEIWRLDF